MKTNQESIQEQDGDDYLDPNELERMVMREMYALILQLPRAKKQGSFLQDLDEEAGVDFGAFATVDFDRIRPKFDKTRYVIDRLRQELRHVMILLKIVEDRIPGLGKYQVLKYLGRSVIALEDIPHDDLRAMGELYLRARRIVKDITRLGKRRGEKARARGQKFLATG